MSTDSSPTRPPAWAAYAFLSAIALALFCIRLTGAPDLMDNDQERPSAYVLDAVCNGHWLCQRDATGDITSKPPLYTWLAALATLPGGRIHRVTLDLPSALATMLTAWLIFAAGQKRFGWHAGWLGAAGFLLSGVALKAVGLARTDALFALGVAVAALAAFNAWTRGGGWIWFWLAAAAAALTKGPLGVLLAAAGLLAAIWEQRSGTPLRLRGGHTAGVLLFILLAGGWFALAYREMGPPLVDKMISRELVGHITTETGQPKVPGAHFLKPLIYFLVRFVPWSLLAGVGFWRVVYRPSPDPGQRRFERFLFCWFWAGLLVFSLTTHQRSDLLFPLLPAAALLAGRELARATAAIRPTLVFRATALVAVVVLAGLLRLDRWAAARNPFVRRTVGMEELARVIRDQGGDEFPLTHVDDPFALQFYLNTARPMVSFDRAARLLRDDSAAFVVVRDWAKLRASLGPDSPELHELARWPASGEPFVRIVSNHPKLELPAQAAFCSGPLRVGMNSVRLREVEAGEMRFERHGPNAAITFHNESEQAVPVRVWLLGQPPQRQHTVLAPGVIWSVTYYSPKPTPVPLRPEH